MEIELDPIASLFSARARARALGGGRFGLRHPKPQARLNNPMTEKEPKAAHCTAAPAKRRSLKNFSETLARQKRLRLCVSHLPSSSFQDRSGGGMADTYV